MATNYNDEITHKKTLTIDGPLVINGDVTYADPPPGVSLDDLVNLTGSGAATFADLVATDDLTVGDDATITGDLAVGGASALHAVGITGALTVSTTSTLTGNVSCGAALAITGATTAAALTTSGTLTTSGSLDVNGALDLAGATITMPTGYRLPQYLEVAFVVGDIQAGIKTSSSLPTNFLLVGVHIQMTTALTFSDVATTGVSATIGNAGTGNAYGTSITLGTSTGYIRPAPGASGGGVVAGGSGGLVVAFTATGDTPDLADVSAGAGKIVVHYITV